MANLIPMEQAAEMLGMTVEKLTELRSNNEIFGYRDGQNWQFKISELERVANELGVQLKDADEAPLLLDDDDDDLGFELSDSSTEISSADLSASLEEDTSKPVDGFNLDESSEFALEDSGELLMLEGDSDVLSSDDATGEEEGLSFGSSDISLAASSKDLPSPSDTNALLADGSNLLDDEAASSGVSPSDTGMMLAAADSIDGDDDDLFGDDLELIEDDSFEESAELSSDFEDSDLVLDDSDSSAEIVLAGGESGINLGKNASGIELDEEPLELGGSDIDSLELPEDDDELLELDDLGSGVGTLAQEDEFKLTALEEDLDDQSSGSQVIALEDSAIYSDEGEASILGSEEFAAQPEMLPASDPGVTPGGEVDSIFDQAGVATTGAAVGGMGAAAMVPAAVEAPYTIWQVIGLGFVAALLLVGGMIGYDIARNLWMPEDQVISTGVMKFFLEITGLG